MNEDFRRGEWSDDSMMEIGIEGMKQEEREFVKEHDKSLSLGIPNPTTTASLNFVLEL